MLSVTNKPFMLSVVKLNVVMLNVVAPILVNVEKTSFDRWNLFVCLRRPERLKEENGG
jgi:hypothetical protein